MSDDPSKSKTSGKGRKRKQSIFTADVSTANGQDAASGSSVKRPRKGGTAQKKKAPVQPTVWPEYFHNVRHVFSTQPIKAYVETALV